MTKLTELETKVLAILKQNADDISGGDFAIMEEVDVRSLSLNRQQLGGVVQFAGPEEGHSHRRHLRQQPAAGHPGYFQLAD